MTILNAVIQMLEDGAGRYEFTNQHPLHYQSSIFRLKCLDYDLKRIQAPFRAKIHIPAYDG